MLSESDATERWTSKSPVCRYELCGYRQEDWECVRETLETIGSYELLRLRILSI
jgi:hypothetical protein